MKKLSGTRFLFISNDLDVYKIPIPKASIYKAVPQLANQSVLEVILYYETNERKPINLVDVWYNRLQLDSNGQYELTQKEIAYMSRNFILFSLQTPETLSKQEKPLPIPSALVMPTLSEKEALIKYIKKSMPKLYPQGAYVIERAIQSRTEINKKNTNLVKQAARLKRKNK